MQMSFQEDGFHIRFRPDEFGIASELLKTIVFRDQESLAIVVQIINRLERGRPDLKLV